MHYHEQANTPDDEIELPPSKTKIKQQMHELQDLGERLTELSMEKLRELDLPERLLDAIKELKKINKFGAQRRQLQYIGRLMREVEPEPIVARLDAWNGVSATHVAWLHRLEQWRDRLLDQPDALGELLAAHPQADGQRLRALVRNAIKERELMKPPKNYREIFQMLKEIMPE